MAKYGHGTPDDWMERNVYTRHSVVGVSLMLLLDVALFGAAGLTVWAIQMVWIPITAAGIINGIGHYWGYRNFEASDATTVPPWRSCPWPRNCATTATPTPTSARFGKAYNFDGSAGSTSS